MTSGPLEKEIVNSIVKFLRSHPLCVVRKRHGTPMGISGDPDLYGSIWGRHFELEVKRPGAVPTALQEARMKEWRDVGAIVAVVHSVDEVRKLLLGEALCK